MSKAEPDCPLYNHNSCGKLYHPQLCALAREDKQCMKRHQKPRKKETEKVDEA